MNHCSPKLAKLKVYISFYFISLFRVVAELRDVSGSLRQKELCLDSMNHGAGGCIEMFACHEMGKNQVTKSNNDR